MATTLSYTIVNSSLADQIVDTVLDGQPAQIHQNRRIVEMTSDDAFHGTIKLVLLPQESEQLVEGAKVNVTFNVG